MKKLKGVFYPVAQPKDETKKKNLIVIDNGMVIARGKRGQEEVEKDKGGINGNGRKLDLGDEHTIQYKDNAL